MVGLQKRGHFRGPLLPKENQAYNAALQTSAEVVKNIQAPVQIIAFLVHLVNLPDDRGAVAEHVHEGVPNDLRFLAHTSAGESFLPGVACKTGKTAPECISTLLRKAAKARCLSADLCFCFRKNKHGRSGISSPRRLRSVPGKSSLVYKKCRPITLV